MKIKDKVLILRIKLAQKRGKIKKWYSLSQKYWTNKGVVFGGERAIAFYTCNLDCSKKGLITIGDNTMITAETQILTHDYSIQKALEAYNKDYSNHTVVHIGKVEIGKNCFVGNRAIILPDTTIGDNCIIGSGAVLRGNYPANSIIAGNPAKIIGNTKEWVERKGESYFEYGASWGDFKRK